jgi:hypothetical protein
MNLQDFVTRFNQQNPDPCWRTPGHEMRKWAEEMEAAGAYGHGLGPLDQPCKQTPGTTCPACGKTFKHGY